MSCECIEKICEKVREELDPKAEFEISFMFSKAGGTIEKPTPFRFTYRKKKADGEFYQKKTKSFVQFDFCPFCGTKYIEEEDTENA